MKNKNIKIFIFVITVIVFVNSHKCGIHLLSTPKRVLYSETSPDVGEENIDLSTWSPIRIHFDFSNFPEKYKDLRDYLDEHILSKVSQIFASFLKVHPYKSPISLSPNSCSPIDIPENFIFFSDVVIFVSTDEIYPERRVEAAAIHCVQSSITKRPIVGYIKYSPTLKFNSTNQADASYLIWLSLHEITHILVMNKGLYSDYVDKETNEELGSDVVLSRRVMSNNVKSRYSFIKTPKVMEKARKHFNCDLIKGVPLENKGGAGTTMSHWSKKYMNTDYMIGDSYIENILSDITLALFEDSGWYDVDYTKANVFVWGKGKGCDFFNLQCMSNLKTLFKDEFCMEPNQEVCSITKKSRGLCEMEKENGEYRGTDFLMDKCPIPGNFLETTKDDDEEKEIKEKGQHYYYNSCRYGVRKNIELESIGENSSCFNGRYKKKKDSIALCLEYHCNGETKNYSVIIKGKEYRCNSKTDVISIKSENQEIAIECNDYNVICNNKYKCKFNC